MPACESPIRQNRHWLIPNDGSPLLPNQIQLHDRQLDAVLGSRLDWPKAKHPVEAFSVCGFHEDAMTSMLGSDGDKRLQQ